MKLPPAQTHQKGECFKANKKSNLATKNISLPIETFNGRVHVEWDPQAEVTLMGQLAFFIEFLKEGDLFDPFVEDCPLKLISPNAPSNRDVLGTLLLSGLAGHKRYAHVTAIRCDNVNPKLLGMGKVVSEDSLRRAMSKIDEVPGIEWLQKHLDKCTQPVLGVDWILDIDTTVKALYGKQEGAEVGYNPKKPGRPSHVYHTYCIANLRMILDVEVQPGDQSAASHSAPDLFDLLDRTPKVNWPKFIRGDCAFGTDGVMSQCEAKRVPYLFKLKQTPNVKKLIELLETYGEWTIAGQGWEGQEAPLQLQGWSKNRRAIVLRKKVSKNLGVWTENTETKQREFNFAECTAKGFAYEYAVLVTSLPDEIFTVAQHYRDRGDDENVFDELKNQWGWGGYTTQDLKRCRLVARALALFYNWWSLFVRLAEPKKHLEAVTSRPLLLQSIGKQTTHAGQTRISITSSHGKNKKASALLNRVANFFKELQNCAEQLSSEQRWYRILSKALSKYLHGKILELPKYLPALI